MTLSRSGQREVDRAVRFLRDPPDAMKIRARTAEYPLTENARFPFQAEPGHAGLARPVDISEAGNGDFNANEGRLGALCLWQNHPLGRMQRPYLGWDCFVPGWLLPPFLVVAGSPAASPRFNFWILIQALTANLDSCDPDESFRPALWSNY